MKKMVIVVEDGRVSAVYAEDPSAVDVVVVDCDTEGDDEDRLISEEDLLTLLGEKSLKEIQYSAEAYRDYETGNSISELISKI